MKTFALRLAATLILLTGVGLAQASLTQTSLSAAVSGPAGFSGTSQTFDTQVTVSSTTSLVAPLNGAIQSVIYIDKELMGVNSFNTTTKVVQVSRGYNGTQAQPHISGAMVLVGLPSQFFVVDPVGSCLSTATVVTPWVNVITGYQWLCSTLTNSWVPGWGNPGTSAVPVQVTAAVASAAGLITPSGPLFHITGTAAITGFNIPVGFQGGSFCAYADAVWTWTAANNIQVAGTVTTGNQVPVCFTFDANTSKFIPSRVS